MSFNPNLLKQVTKVIFYRETNATTHPNLIFSNDSVNQALS